MVPFSKNLNLISGLLLDKDFEMNRLFFFTLMLLLFAGVLVACNNEGVAAFSPGNDYVAVITNNKRLFTSTIDGSIEYPIHYDTLLTGFNVSFDPTGSRLLYGALVDDQSSICVSDPQGYSEICPWITLPENTFAGVLSFLPNGQFIVAYQIDEKWELRVYEPDGALDRVNSMSAIDHLLLSSEAYKVKRNTSGREWYLTPYKAGIIHPLRFIVVQRGIASLSTPEDNFGVPREFDRFDPAVARLLTLTDEQDITSVVLSPDGNSLALRTKDEDNYSLFVVDLAATSSQPINLVRNANFRIQFDFSPDGSQLVYESNVDGRSIWLTDADGENPHKMADNASFPEWH